jgi:uncharacterized repeat protein (TIGR03803 family)
MNARLKILCLTLLGGLLLSSQPIQGQTLLTLHHFTNTPDGANPRGGLILSGGFLYGTTQQGGTLGAGTIFRINPDGTGITNLHNFPPLEVSATLETFTNGDGAYPVLVLVDAAGTLYGTSAFGGTNGDGTIFSLSADGSVFTVLYTFSRVVGSGSEGTNSDGSGPSSSLILSGDTLYGVTMTGGASACGALFAINTNGLGFTNLHSFTGGGGGRTPAGGLRLSGSTLFGTTAQGGANTEGMVYSIQTDSTGFSDLFDFPNDYTDGNSEGAFPQGTLVLSGETLYGAASSGGIGGAGGAGVIFSLAADTPHAFTNLHSFNSSIDGGDPIMDLILVDGVLYGTTISGGSANNGSVFCIGTNGGFTNLHTFEATAGSTATNSDGATPFCTLLYANNSLYGLASRGGAYGHGTLFKLVLPGPALSLTGFTATSFACSWPTNASGFTLQSAPSLQPANWSNVTVTPSVVNGFYTVTVPFSAAQQFYRLQQ